MAALSVKDLSIYIFNTPNGRGDYGSQQQVRPSDAENAMPFLLLADLVLLLHLAFVAFAAFGGLLVLRRPKILWLHLPALLWGVLVQWADWICPLTPLENRLRLMGGGEAYAGGFIERLVSGILYPDNLTLELRHVLGIALIAVNVAVYAYVLAMRARRKSRAG
jgi:hypothetical protein